VVRKIIRDTHVSSTTHHRIRLARASNWLIEADMYGYETLANICWSAAKLLMSYPEHEFPDADKLWLAWPQQKAGWFDVWIPVREVVYGPDEETVSQLIDPDSLQADWMVNLVGLARSEL
jgi:hypothetical protein